MGNPFETKSNSNWAVGKRCLEANDTNAAANRFYYALFQAAKGYFVERGDLEMDHAVKIHATVANLITPDAKAGSRRGWQRRTLTDLMGLREIADYYPEDVDLAELNKILISSDKVRAEFLQMK
jgi:hypothetical protein